ncbi:(2Fe-2S)-binding protein [Bradyrhizobium sp. USDA 4501]
MLNGHYLTGSRGSEIELSVNGNSVVCHRGDTLLAALLASGLRSFRRSIVSNEPRAPCCNTGVCFDCMVTVNGTSYIRACMIDAEPGMAIETGDKTDG